MNRHSGKDAKTNQLSVIFNRVLRIVGFTTLAFCAGLVGAAIYSAVNRDADPTTDNQTSLGITSIKTEDEAISQVVDKVSPSVVSIISSEAAPQNNDSWRYWSGEYEMQSSGTGVIISSNGYIITNKHVISGNTGNLKVITRDGTEYDDVDIIGSDPLNDIAFLKINGADGLVAAQFGDSRMVKVGSRVIAIGNALGEYQNTVTSGIISAKGRTISAEIDSGSTETLTNLFQTDTAINAGNSGGPLVTLDGKVIGINTAIIEDAQGIGFAIPITEARGVMNSVLKKGKVERAYLGARYIMLTKPIAHEKNLPTSEGAYLEGGNGPVVADNSPAARAGLRTGDIIVAANDAKIDINNQPSSVISSLQVGDKLKLSVLRGDQKIDVIVELGKYE